MNRLTLKSMTTWMLLLLLALLLGGPLLSLAFGRASLARDWSTATHRASGIAPEPSTHRDAVVQVYAGRTFGWRGVFAVHTWLAAKPAGADRYTRYEVIGWRARRGLPVISVSGDRAPDAEWFGSPPELLRDVRGAEAEAIISKLPAAIERYPFAGSYSAWPGPNSNTFVAHIGRELPELRLSLPPTAIGKDYLPVGEWIARTPSGTGFQMSVAGLVGIAAAAEEGIELNVLGLVTGFGLSPPALKLPGVGLVPGRF
jgi:hypothetical protein